MLGIKLTCSACVARAAAVTGEGERSPIPPLPAAHLVLGTALCDTHAAATWRLLHAALQRAAAGAP